MKDMTKGSVTGHVLQLAGFIALSTVFQTLYFLADLYFVGRLGKEALAGVGLSGNLMFLVLAVTQSLGVGTTSLIAQALGRGDKAQAEHVFNQSMLLSALTGVGLGAVLFAARGAYCRWLAADAATAELGTQYLDWFVPALALQFVLVAMGAALRGMGDVKVPTVLQIGTVVLNILLAPTLMFGWITERPLGVAGTALASLLSVAFCALAFTAYFCRKGSPLRLRRAAWVPDRGVWSGILSVGLPAGGEFALISFYMVFVYHLVRPFGAAAQAGFGVGLRVMQSLFLPAVAIAFATAPVAGQNFGARLGERVRRTFRAAGALSAGIMAVLTLLCQIAPDSLVRLFNEDPAVVVSGAEYLRIVSWNFVASGVVFVSSSVFQGLGHTLPPLASSSLRLLAFVGLALVLSGRPGFELRQIWWLAVAVVTAQMGLNLWLLQRELDRRLPRQEPRPDPVAA